MATQERARWAVLGAVTSLVAVVACSSTNDRPGTTTGPDGSASGSNGPGAAANSDASSATTGDGAATCSTLGLHVDAFAPGLKKAGKDGVFTFVLVSSDPSPPNDPQMNTWTIQVLDASGAPVTDATVTLPAGNVTLGWSAPKNPWMPTMNHGSSIANTITDNGDGTTKVQIYFTMSGLWQTFIRAQSGQMADSAMYSFCLP